MYRKIFCYVIEEIYFWCLNLKKFIEESYIVSTYLQIFLDKWDAIHTMSERNLLNPSGIVCSGCGDLLLFCLMLWQCEKG